MKPSVIRRLSRLLLVPALVTLVAGIAFAVSPVRGASGPHHTSIAKLTVHVTLREYRVVLSTRHLPAKVPIRFVIANRGHMIHELVLERPPDVDKALIEDHERYEADDIKPGQTKTVVWIIPDRGTWKFACHRMDHYQMGMYTLITAT